MTDVANKYFISQSALSNSLLRLEKELGVRIFDRVGRNLVLNEYGRVYLAHIKTALTAIDEGNRALESLNRTRQQKVSVAMSTTLHFGNLISRFLQQYPQFTFSQHKYSLGEGGTPLDVDYIIAGADDLPSTDFESMIFREDRIWLCVPPGNPLSQKDSIYLIEAKDETFINPPESASFTRFLNDMFKQAGFSPNILTECDLTIQDRLLKQNRGVLLYPDAIAQSGFFDYGTHILIKDDFAIRRHCLYWAKNRALSQAAKAFREFLLSESK